MPLSISEVEKTIRIDGLPARAKFNLGTTFRRIEAPRSVLGAMQPGLVSDLVHTTFMLNPTLRSLSIHLDSVECWQGVQGNVQGGAHDGKQRSDPN